MIFIVAAALAVACAGCGSGPTTVPVAADTGFVITGNPEAAGGATWTFRDTVAGVFYDLAGVLYKPPGAGPFPAVILSHGSEGSGAFFSSGSATWT